LPTASAVWSDALEIARNIAHGIPALALELPSVGPVSLPVRPMESVRCAYYLRVMVRDKPGVLSRVAGILGENDISIANVIQKGRGTREAVPVVMLTHEAREKDMRAALAAIDRMRDVATPTTMIRVEDHL
jgi:homoserine dehydrogenase